MRVPGNPACTRCFARHVPIGRLGVVPWFATMLHIDSEYYFLREQVIHVDAAVVGISRERWCYAPSGWTDEVALEAMRKEGFDILPVDDRDAKPVIEYFGTERWNDF